MNIESVSQSIGAWLENLGLSGLILSVLAALLVTVLLFVLLRIKKALTERAQETVAGLTGTWVRPFYVQDQEILSADEILRATREAVDVTWVHPDYVRYVDPAFLPVLR